METMHLSEIKKQASSFIQDKYRSARLVFTDVTPAEILTEEATNNDPSGPDARTMARISEAAYDIDDFWRILDILHQRLYILDLKQWRQHFKSLVLLDFLLTHGPETIAEEFQCDLEVIQDLGTFKHIDERGFDWGAAMKKRAERILQLLEDEELLRDERLKACRVSKEIQGFGNLNASPSSTSSRTPRTSSFSSHSSVSSFAWNESEEVRLELQTLNREFHGNSPVSQEKLISPSMRGENAVGTHLWDTPIEETGSLLDPDADEEAEISSNASSISSPGWRDGGKAVFRSVTNVGKVMMKRFDRQFSLGI